MSDAIYGLDEELVQATVSPRSVGGQSLYRFEGAITQENVDQFRSERGVREAAVRALQHRGFRVYDTQEDAPTISISGPRSLFEQVFGRHLTMHTKQVAPERQAIYFVLEGGPQAQVLEALPDELQHLIEGVSFAEPPELFATAVADPTVIERSVKAKTTEIRAAIEMAGVESALPPLAPMPAGGYRYLFVPDEVGVLLRAALVHRLGTTGLGIRVAMIDTGHYAHPFFSQRGYRVLATVLGPGASDPTNDTHGHGTGESANVFATGPDCTLIPVKMAADTTGAFNAAVAQMPHVITNSWGYDVDLPGTTLPAWLKPLEAAVANAVQKGMVVCFSAGNGHHAFPASHPDVIAVGGVHVNYPSLAFEASNYASSFDSSFYPGRHVPDICGLVGKTPPSGAPLLMLPVQSGAALDFPNTGSTTDGWGMFSGTSAACPQVAGVVALLLQKKKYTPTQVKDILVKHALDIKTGKSAMNDPAGPGWDKATGAGLVDAKWSYIAAFGLAVAEFMSASPEGQAAMLASHQIERMTPAMFEDMVHILRSKV